LNCIANRSKGPDGEKIWLSSIELATKVVDCEEKLRNTLSHEICHIAAWAIDKEMKPAHGPAFKFWGKKIMKARKDISVTTRHSYEIGRFTSQHTACARA
jgi:predicted SprT family Zn-dependent metalloprotease